MKWPSVAMKEPGGLLTEALCDYIRLGLGNLFLKISQKV
jgi:hypothetical protein